MIGKTMLFNPFTGKPRHPDDIKSDPTGLLMWDGEEPLRAAATTDAALQAAYAEGRKDEREESKVLLEALRHIVDDHYFGDLHGDRREAWAQTARAAIAKYTGEQ